MGDTSTLWVILFSLAILLTFAGLIAVFWVGWWMSQRAQGVSPYTGLPLRRASDISFYAIEKTMRYLYDFHQYDNRIFKISRAAFCRETGRIFQESVNWFDMVRVDWDFLQKRYPGNYVSWGSLNRTQQDAIREVHESLARFQTELSSSQSAPRLVEPEFAYLKPGPLYVDIQTKVLLGWQEIPGTDLEVLIVQKPIK